MAKPRHKKGSETDTKRIREMINSVNTMVSDIELSLYGTSSKTDIPDIRSEFDDIMKSQLDLINRQNGGEVSSFMAKLFDNEFMRGSEHGSGGLGSLFSSEDGGVMTYLSEEYQTRISKYVDLKEVSSQLIELREAILVMRDAIVSPDTTEGSVSRTIDFVIESKDVSSMDYRNIIENMEKKFGLHKKIKNFIVPNSLQFGTYWGYCVPYKDLFAKFDLMKNDPRGSHINRTNEIYRESTLYESVLNSCGNDEKEREKQYSQYIKENASLAYDTISKSISVNDADRKIDEMSIAEGLDAVMKNITICNDACPIPFLEEGVPAMEHAYVEYVRENASRTTNSFEAVHNIDTGSYGDMTNAEYKKAQKSYGQIKDCYIKFIDPIHMIPCKIMKKVVGYYYVVEDETTPVGGFFGNNYKYAGYRQAGKERTIVDRIADKVVRSFDKKFLHENIEMKEMIAECLMYVDLNATKLRFQFIPVEYVCPFIVNEDENGEGTSIVEPSLFYAKLYLLLLLFKITSIVLHSNDTRVNYIRTSGIDKNLANKIQQIARDKQRHQVNIMDMKSYTSLIRKVGHGSEQYIPTGRNNERALETEILQGQDIQLNTELMELLRTCYILGTGVPSAIMNYLNEADFAKSIEVANTRFLGRVMSLQMDFNESITEFYRMIAKHSTNIPGESLQNMSIILTAPKNTNNVVKQEAIGGFEALSTFLLKLFFGEDYQSTENPEEKDKQLEFVKYLVSEFLPSINIMEMEKVLNDLDIRKKEKSLDPSKKDTSAIDDLEDMIPGMN